MLKPTLFKFSFPLLVISFLAGNMSMNSNSLASIPHYGKQEKAEWTRYTAAGEEFSVLMPALPSVLSRVRCLDQFCLPEDVGNTYVAYLNGVVYTITSYPNRRQPRPLEVIIAKVMSVGAMSGDDTVESDVKLNRFRGKKFISVSKLHGYDILSTFYLTGAHVYAVTAEGGSRNDPSIQKFFKSFTLSRKKGREIGDGAKSGADSIELTPLPKSDGQNSNVQPAATKGTKGQTVFKPTEVSRKAIIVLKPSPEYTEEARQNQVTGTVTLQMVFDSSGKVVNIRTISGLPYGLTEKAIGAAKKIYFLPAVKDGKRVSQYIRVEYNFNIY